jgi:hypothetical protein
MSPDPADPADPRSTSVDATPDACRSHPAGTAPPEATRIPNYVDRLPDGLRQVLAEGRWLPVIGAGLSACARLEDGSTPLLWGPLGDQLSKELALPSSDPIDALSAYAATYRRPRLVERLGQLLLVDEVGTSATHRAFAQLPFDMVVTTNIDFLLERAYQEQRRPCVPLIGESQLAIPRRIEATYLLKFHGDLNHPNDLVLTEDDYDGFLDRHPLLATFLASAFLTKDPVLIGYSLADADLREILALLRERLGRMTRAVWAILPVDPDNDAQRFERRGVHAVVLDPHADKQRRPEILGTFFRQLRAVWEDDVAPWLDARSDASTAELHRRSGIAPQLALFAANRSVMALFRDFVFPAVPQSGFIPIGVDDVAARDPRIRPMAIDMALSKAAVVVYDTAPGNPLPLDYVVARRGSRPMLVVFGEREEERVLLPPGQPTVGRPMSMSLWEDAFVPGLVQQLVDQRSSATPPSLRDLEGRGEPRELLFTALALLESELRGPGAPTNAPTAMSVTLTRMGRIREVFGVDFDSILTGVKIRHDLLQQLHVPPAEVAEAARTLANIARSRGVVSA